jgi:biopolymer transport protein ExbD
MPIWNPLARASHRADVNVTPMIDVMLVLLIIFMLVTPLISSRSILPRSVYADSRPEADDEITLIIDRQGTFFLRATGDAAPLDLRGPRAMPASVLGVRLNALYQGRVTDRVLYLKADSGLEYGRIEEAIGIARRAGVRVVAAVTEPKPKGSSSRDR